VVVVQGFASPLPVPTLTEWAMVIFILLAGIGSLYYMKKHIRVCLTDRPATHSFFTFKDSKGGRVIVTIGISA
jgi:hypothetical protein